MEEAEAEALRKGFTKDLDAKALIERELIDDLVISRMIRRRIDATFTREFSKASALKPAKLLANHDAGANVYWQRSELRRGKPRGTSNPCAHADLCVEVLEDLAGTIRDRGLRPFEDREVLQRLYGTEFTSSAGPIADMLMKLCTLELMGQKLQEDDLEAIKQGILECISAEIEVQKHRAELDAEVIDIDVACEIQEPPAAVLDTLLRYRAANTREFKSLLESFESARRIRQTEN